METKQKELTIYLVRHGEYDDSGLTDAGKEQIAKTAAEIGAELKSANKSLDSILLCSSPQLRTAQSAEIVMEKLGLAKPVMEKKLDCDDSYNISSVVKSICLEKYSTAIIVTHEPCIQSYCDEKVEKGNYVKITRRFSKDGSDSIDVSLGIKSALPKLNEALNHALEYYIAIDVLCQGYDMLVKQGKKVPENLFDLKDIGMDPKQAFEETRQRLEDFAEMVDSCDMMLPNAEIIADRAKRLRRSEHIGMMMKMIIEGNYRQVPESGFHKSFMESYRDLINTFSDSVKEIEKTGSRR